ncbi:MAG TPA: hypothetical protein VHF24_03770 [Acidimicrobiales bacterium]|nr:hypothetical protein [Acidimicrobiales bacterium]
MGVAGGARRVARRRGRLGARPQVAGEVGGPAQGDQHPAVFGGRQRSGGDRQRGAIEAGAVLVGEAPHGVVRRPDRPRSGRLRLAVRCQLGPVPGDLGEVLGEVAGAPRLRLDRLGHGPVEGDPLGRGERRLDRLAGEGVDEPVVPGLAGAMDEAVGDRLVQRGKALRHRRSEGPGDDGEREVTPGHRGRPDEAAALRRDPVEARPDDVEHRAGRSVRAPRAVGHGPGHLPHEQRVAAGDLEHGAGVGGGADPRRPGQLLAHLGQVEPSEVQALDRRRPQEVGEHPPEGARRFPVAESGEHEQPGAGKVVTQVAQDEERRLVGPVHVVENHDQTAPGAGGSVHRVGHLLDDAEPVLGRLDGAPEREVGVGPERAEHLAPRPERRCPLGLDRPSPRHRDAGGEGHPRELLGEPRLADPGLAGAEDEAPPPVTGGGQPGPKGVELPPPPNDAVRRHEPAHGPKHPRSAPTAATLPAADAADSRRVPGLRRRVGRDRPRRALHVGGRPAPGVEVAAGPGPGHRLPQVPPDQVRHPGVGRAEGGLPPPDGGPLRRLELSEPARFAIYRQHMRLQPKIGLQPFAVVMRQPQATQQLGTKDPRDVTWQLLLRELERFTVRNKTEAVLVHDQQGAAVMRHFARRAYRQLAGNPSARPATILLDGLVAPEAKASSLFQLADLNAHAAFRAVYPPPASYRYPIVVPQTWNELGEARLTPLSQPSTGPRGILLWP